MTDKELLQKVENGEGLTVPEIKRYQQLVKPQKLGGGGISSWVKANDTNSTYS